MPEPVMIVTVITAIISGITAILQGFQSAKIHDIDLDSNCCAVKNTNTTVNNYSDDN